MSNVARCSACKQEKDRSEFYASKARSTGINGLCKPCSRQHALRWNRENATRLKERVKRNKRWLSDKVKEYRIANKEKFHAATNAWRHANPEAWKAITKRSRDKKRELGIKGERRVKLICRASIPPWANKFFISEIYKLSVLRSQMTGLEYHVDHIVPLRSKLVCGLHVEGNLQIVPASENLKKGNRYWQGMP